MNQEFNNLNQGNLNSFDVQNTPVSNSQLNQNNDNNPLKSKKKKLGLIIGIVAIILIIGIVVVVLFGGNKQNNSGNNTGNHQVENRTIDTELRYSEKILKDSYSMDEIIKYFSFSDSNYTFTENESVKFDNISQNAGELSMNMKIYLDNGKDYIPVYTSFHSLSISDKIDNYKNDNEYTIVDSDDSSISAIRDLSYTKYYIYVTKFQNQLAIFEYRQNKKGLQLDQDTIFNLLKKGITSLSVDDSAPYLYDMATFLPLPFNKKVVSFLNIADVYENGLEITTNPEDQEKWVIYKIEVYYDLKENVKLEKVSTNPKIDTFEYVSSFNSSLKYPYFRIYDNNRTYDITIAVSTYDDKNYHIDNVDEVLPILDLIENK